MSVQTVIVLKVGMESTFYLHILEKWPLANTNSLKTLTETGKNNSWGTIVNDAS